MIWAQGSPSTLRAITTVIAGVKLTLAAAICWENYMPLLRFSLYSQNVNLYLAPTVSYGVILCLTYSNSLVQADGRDTWLSLMRTIALEGRTFVLSANQCSKRKHLPKWIKDDKEKTGTQRNVSAKNTVTETKSRRSSFVTKTEDGHEITWPLTGGRLPIMTDESEDQKSAVDEERDQNPLSFLSRPPSKKAITTKIEDNHEIKLPPHHPNQKLRSSDIDTLRSAATQSPLRFGTLSTDNDTNHKENTNPRAPGVLLPQGSLTKVPESNFALPSKSCNTHKSCQATWPLTTVEVPSDLPPANTPQPSKRDEEFVSRGGSCIISPDGSVLAGPLWEVESGLLFATVDFEDCERGRLDMDVAGSYGRLDAFDLRVRGLDISPPP